MGKQVAKRRKPDWETRDMNQDVKGKGWKEKILETFHESLSLPSALTSHLKGKCGERGRHGTRDLLLPCMTGHLLFGIQCGLENQVVMPCGSS